MKALLVFPIFFLFLNQGLQSQPDTLVKRDHYRAWISTYDSSKVKSGELYEIRDSSIVVINQGNYNFDPPVKSDTLKIDIKSVDAVKIRKKGNVGKGILIGALSGLVAGGVVDLIYYASWKSYVPPRATNIGDGIANAMAKDPRIFSIAAGIIGIAFVGTGISIGAAVGSARISFPIKGNQEQFEQNTLYNSLGGENFAAGKLAENFTNSEQTIQWWTSTQQDAGHAQCFYFNNQTMGVFFTVEPKATGLKVRCMRDY